MRNGNVATRDHESGGHISRRRFLGSVAAV